MFFIVPTEIGTLNTPLNISWVRLKLTAPMVFKATASASRFCPYWTTALISAGKEPVFASPQIGHTGIVISSCSVTSTWAIISISWRISFTSEFIMQISRFGQCWQSACRWLMTWSGSESTARCVPEWPFWPPCFFPLFSRKLLFLLTGFFLSPSDDGGF